MPMIVISAVLITTALVVLRPASRDTIGELCLTGIATAILAGVALYASFPTHTCTRGDWISSAICVASGSFNFIYFKWWRNLKHWWIWVVLNAFWLGFSTIYFIDTLMS